MGSLLAARDKAPLATDWVEATLDSLASGFPRKVTLAMRALVRLGTLRKTMRTLADNAVASMLRSLRSGLAQAIGGSGDDGAGEEGAPKSKQHPGTETVAVLTGKEASEVGALVLLRK